MSETSFTVDKIDEDLPITLVAALLLRILAPALAELGVANNARVLTVEQDVLQILILKIGALEDILQIRLSEAYSVSQMHTHQTKR